MNERIIIAEDDESIRRLLEVALSSHGYVPISFDSAEAALAEMEHTPPAVAIFDIMLTGVDGLDAVRLMRDRDVLKHVPVILLTARDTELDKIVGLDAGADDYITKPFSVLELCARVRALLRRGVGKQEAADMTTCVSGGLILNRATWEASINGASLDLTRKEFELLLFLMEHRDRAVTRDVLLSEVWGTDYYGETRTLDIHIATVRGKLRDLDPNTSYIKTVRGVGYRFVGGDKQ